MVHLSHLHQLPSQPPHLLLPLLSTSPPCTPLPSPQPFHCLLYHQLLYHCLLCCLVPVTTKTVASMLHCLPAWSCHNNSHHSFFISYPAIHHNNHYHCLYIALTPHLILPQRPPMLLVHCITPFNASQWPLLLLPHSIASQSGVALPFYLILPWKSMSLLHHCIATEKYHIHIHHNRR